MKIIQKQNTTWISSNFFGYFLAKKYFKGELKRGISLTIYDKELNISSYGDLYICNKNTILVVYNMPNFGFLLELDSTDQMIIIENNNQDLLKKSVSSGVQFETPLKISTTYPIAYIELNSKYLLLLDIQEDLKYTSIVNGSLSRPIKNGSLFEIVLTGKDYVLKVKNSLNMIHLSIMGELNELSLPIHGMSPIVVKINLSLIFFFLFILPLIFLYLVIITL